MNKDDIYVGSEWQHIETAFNEAALPANSLFAFSQGYLAGMERWRDKKHFVLGKLRMNNKLKASVLTAIIWLFGYFLYYQAVHYTAAMIIAGEMLVLFVIPITFLWWGIYKILEEGVRK